MNVARRVALTLALVLLPSAFTWAQDTDAATAPPPEPPASIPPVTDADRHAAFPGLAEHPLHGTGIHSLVLVERLEWQGGRGDDDASAGARGWVGGDLHRMWFRADADVDAAGGTLEGAAIQAFYGRAVFRWWDVVAGVRHDTGPGPDRTWAAVGIQGLAPYWFELDATAYVGESGRTALHLAAEYDLLITNRLILQPSAGLDIYGKDDQARDIGRGLSSAEAGLRLRYILRREFAPYVGVAWRQAFYGTADAARRAGEPVRTTRALAGVRVWF